MIRNLKVLGLALAAVFAMSAVAASAASAQNGMLTSDGPVTLVGTETGEPGANALTAFEDAIECPGTVYTGHKVEVTPHEPVPSKASAVTITPHYGSMGDPENGECFSVKTGLPVTVFVPEECDYEFDIGETIEEHVYKVTTTIEPKGCKIPVKVYTGASHSIVACTITVSPETDYDGLHAKDNTDGTITITGTISGLPVQRSGFGCSSGEEEGELEIDAIVEGRNASNKVTAISLSHE